MLLRNGLVGLITQAILGVRLGRRHGHDGRHHGRHSRHWCSPLSRLQAGTRPPPREPLFRGQMIRSVTILPHSHRRTVSDASLSCTSTKSAIVLLPSTSGCRSSSSALANVHFVVYLALPCVLWQTISDTRCRRYALSRTQPQQKSIARLSRLGNVNSESSWTFTFFFRPTCFIGLCYRCHLFLRCQSHLWCYCAFTSQASSRYSTWQAANFRTHVCPKQYGGRYRIEARSTKHVRIRISDISLAG